MKVCIFILLAVETLFGQINLKISVSGTITNSSGESVSGVNVCSTSLNCVLTDSDGRYRIDKFRIHSMRFSHPKYNAIIKESSDDRIDIVMQKSTKTSDNKRTIPHCSENDSLIGKDFKVIIPSKNIIKSRDIDYTMIRVPSSGNETEYLILMEGPNVSSGIPTKMEWPLLEESPVIIFDRDIHYENKKDENGITINSAIDIKARSEDGKFWRFIGDSFEIITYRNVSEETAREFDDIMDTLCIAPQGSAN